MYIKVILLFICDIKFTNNYYVPTYIKIILSHMFMNLSLQYYTHQNYLYNVNTLL